MFGISLIGFDLSDPNYRLFNITLAQIFYGPAFSPINTTIVPL